jgi:hypothetical protein
MDGVWIMQLLERHRNAEIYDLGNGRRQFIANGDIYNPLPFDGGPRAPGNFIYDEGVQQGSWKWLGKGEQGYLVKPSTGTVRVYPVRGNTDKYIQISGLADKVCEVNQIDDRNLEIYSDKTYTRWSLKMGPQGFKPEIILKPGYSGNGVFQFRFELNGGLMLDGAKIMDGNKQVLRMYSPFLVDANGMERGIQESLVDGVVTLTADLDGVAYPCLIDPTLGPISPDKDTRLNKFSPTTGFGQGVSLLLINEIDAINRILIQFDISAIPAGSTITSATYEQYYFAASRGTPTGLTTVLNRCTRTDWDDTGNNTANAEANWNDYLVSGPTAWTSAGGDFTTVDSVTSTVPSVGNWEVYTPTAIAQDALDGLMSMLIKFQDETGPALPNGDAAAYRAREYGTASERPKLTVVYTEAVEDNLMGGGLMSENVLNGGSFSNYGGFGF